MAELITYDPPDADYGRIFTQARIIAWQYGFALLTHGSRTRDLDVLMVPWEDRAYAKIVPAVINRIAQVCGLTVKGEPTDKPHGRKAWTLFLPDGVRWVDLSVMPVAAPVQESEDKPPVGDYIRAALEALEDNDGHAAAVILRDAQRLLADRESEDKPQPSMSMFATREDYDAAMRSASTGAGEGESK